MKTNFTKAILLLTIFNLLYFYSKAQCPSIVVSSTTVNNATCPSGGSITVNATGTLLQYAIINGPAGYLATTNNTGIFSGLITGTYTIQITDNCGINTVVTPTVNNSYAAFSVSSTNITNVCNAFTAGGTVNATVTGGRAPFQYDIVPVGNAPVYSGNSGSTNFSKNFTAFGNYRVFAKDACGEVRTRDVSINKIQQKPDYWWSSENFDRPCAETIDGLKTATLSLNMFNESGVGYDAATLIGARINIYKPSIANSITETSQDGSCSNSTGALLSTFLVSNSNMSAGDYSEIKFTIPREDLIIEIRTLCGDVTKICYDYYDGDSDAPAAIINLVQNTCNANWNLQNLFIRVKDRSGLVEPVSFRLTKANAVQITNSTGSYSNLVPADFPATITLTDACGTTLVKNVVMPTQGLALTAVVEPEWNYTCTNAKTSVTAEVIITSGDLQGMLSASSVTITGGPATIVPSVSGFNDWSFGFTASNIVAGYTYKIMVTNTCNEKDSVSFTVPADSYNQPPLNWNLVANKTQLCGNNYATIVANANYVGSDAPTYMLYNKNDVNTPIATNISGFFENVNFGEYRVKFFSDNSSVNCPDSKITDSIDISILNTAIGQSITKKTIMLCETAGVPQAYGKAVVEVNGNGPFTYEIIKSDLIGTGATEVWTVSSINNSNNFYTWDLPLAGDPYNTIYTLRSTDDCGNKITTIASLQPISPAQSYNDIQPCIGQLNYSFGMRAYAGNAFNYRWVKLPDLATTIATTSVLTFSGAYNVGLDGNYKCFVSYGTCLSREFNYTLNSTECGKTLPILLHQFTGSKTDNEVVLNWKSLHEQYLQKYEIERSTNGLTFEKIASISIKENKSITNNYTYKDYKLPITETSLYYRLKLVEYGGRINYSPIIRFNNNHNFNNLTLAPNPVRVETVLNFKSEISGKLTMYVYDQTGNIVDKQLLQVVKGYNALQVIPNVVAGVYAIHLQIGNNTMKSKFIKL